MQVCRYVLVCVLLQAVIITPPGRLSALSVTYVNRFGTTLLHGRAGRFTAENGRFRPRAGALAPLRRDRRLGGLPTARADLHPDAADESATREGEGQGQGQGGLGVKNGRYIELADRCCMPYNAMYMYGRRPTYLGIIPSSPQN